MSWDVPFGPLVTGTFVERLSRFHARVVLAESGTGRGRPQVAHLPNSGRLRELLLAGNEVLLAPRSAPWRRTAFDLVLARVPEAERGPGGPEIPWACVDARLPPRILAAAVVRGAVPGLTGATVLAVEPPLGRGRADLLLAQAGTEILVEAKSITLVRRGAGLFPDSPTLRGTGHVAALARERRRRALLAFVVQRPDARAVRANEPADPAFARVLRRAQREGVAVVCGTCDVSLEGIRWREAVPVEWFGPGAPAPTLPDYLGPGLRLLVCGMNPGRYAAWYGMYFARPGNLFWPAARAAGLVPAAAGPGDERWLARERGIGFTDVVKRATGGIDDVAPGEWEAGAAGVRRLLRDLRPRAVCFVGLRGARAVVGPGARPGPQPESVDGVPAFALPATSGRQAAYGRREVFAWFRALAAWLASRMVP